MKDWFKYEFGFVNIDSDNLYFTNTGNWSETKGLKEKGVQKSNRGRKIRIQLFLLGSAIGLGALLFNNVVAENLSIVMVIGSAFTFYSLYNYMKTEIGHKFKLPISKVINVKF